MAGLFWVQELIQQTHRDVDLMRAAKGLPPHPWKNDAPPPVEPKELATMLEVASNTPSDHTEISRKHGTAFLKTCQCGCNESFQTAKPDAMYRYGHTPSIKKQLRDRGVALGKAPVIKDKGISALRVDVNPLRLKQQALVTEMDQCDELMEECRIKIAAAQTQKDIACAKHEKITQALELLEGIQD